MKELLVAFLIAVLGAGLLFGTCSLFVDTANAKETTTLEDALERPVKVKSFVDEEQGVVCYYVGRYPRYVSCVKLEKK